MGTTDDARGCFQSSAPLLPQLRTGRQSAHCLRWQVRPIVCEQRFLFVRHPYVSKCVLMVELSCCLVVSPTSDPYDAILFTYSHSFNLDLPPWYRCILVTYTHIQSTHNSNTIVETGDCHYWRRSRLSTYSLWSLDDERGIRSVHFRWKGRSLVLVKPTIQGQHEHG